VNCLVDYVQVAWCGATSAPPSGLYINSLPGITFKGLQSIASEDQQTFADMWSDIQTRASRRFDIDIRQKFGRKWKLKQIPESRNMGWEIDPATAVSLGGANIYGFLIELDCNTSDDFMESALYELYLQQLFIFPTESKTITTITLRVFEVDTGGLIYTKAFTDTVFTAQQWAKLDVGFNFINDRTTNDVAILNNSEHYIVTVELSDTLTSLAIAPPSQDYCECCGFEITPGYVTSVTVPVTSMTAEATFGGVSAIIGSRCSWSRLVCSNMDVFTTPWWYLLGVETMNEQLNSTRLNRYTTIDRKQAAELRKYYEIMYMGGTIDGISYEGALNQATDTINIDCSDCCVECEGALKIMESTL